MKYSYYLINKWYNYWEILSVLALIISASIFLFIYLLLIIIVLFDFLCG